MRHLSQTIAIEKDTKDKAAGTLARARGILTNRGLLSGIARSYTPKDDEGEKLPPESTRVQYAVPTVLKSIREDVAALFDVVATKDYTNCLAKADIMVDGQTLLKDVPTTYILFLEKQLAELLSFVKSIPTLDASEEWSFDAAQNCYATPAKETTRSKKEPRVLVVAPATKEHPQQAQVYMEDVPAGTWRTIHYSGCLPAKEHDEMISRIERLQRAVKFAREEANRHETREQHVGDAFLQYIFG